MLERGCHGGFLLDPPVLALAALPAPGAGSARREQPVCAGRGRDRGKGRGRGLLSEYMAGRAVGEVLSRSYGPHGR